MRRSHYFFLLCIYTTSICSSSLIDFSRRSKCNDCQKQDQTNSENNQTTQSSKVEAFAISTTNAQATTISNGVITISMATAEAIAIAGTVKRNILNGSFSASSAGSAAVTSNNILVSAAASSTQVEGNFKINLNNFKGTFVFSFSESYAIVSQNSIVAKDCSTYSIAYTQNNDSIVFGEMEAPTSPNCSEENALNLIGKVAQLVKITKKGNDLEFQSDNEKMTLRFKYKRHRKQKAQQNDMEGVYAIEYPSQTAELKNNKIYFEGCTDHPIQYTCNELGDITVQKYPGKVQPACLRNKESMLKSLRQASKVVGREDKKNIMFRDKKGHNLVSCSQRE